MTYSSKMIDYLGGGLDAAKPVAATLGALLCPGMIGYYLSTDVAGGTMYALPAGGSAWIPCTLGASLDTDGTLAANSDIRVPSQKAVKTYVDAAVVGLLDYKGSVDCSANPNYPAALKGDSYVVSVAGKIGGASGVVVTPGDFMFCKADSASGDQAAVGANWDVLQYNLDGALISSNNLSDVSNPTQARRNLGIEPAPTAMAGTAYTLALSDDGQYIRTGSASATTITIPTNATVAFAIGAVVTIEQGAAGLVSIAAAGGVTLNSRSGAVNSAGQWAVIQLKKVATDTWTLIGDAA